MIAPCTSLCDLVTHHLRLFGVANFCSKFDDGTSDSLVLYGPDASYADSAIRFSGRGGLVVALMPETSFCASFEITQKSNSDSSDFVLHWMREPRAAWHQLRTLHTYTTYANERIVPVIADRQQRPAWGWIPINTGGILFIGTDLGKDLLRYRQGDDSKASRRPTREYWGVACERPIYLFEDQLDKNNLADRPADWWCMALATFMSTITKKPLKPILPSSAPGAIVVTGDDDQAYLNKYEEQLKLLGATPITYFLHPLSRHTKKTLRAMARQHRIDLGIHPDALDAPQQYDQLLNDQVMWYRKLTGSKPLSVRNHGFLNDGYWRHLTAWLKNDIRISSNLPGLDGTVLNGSLLPARVLLNGQLTSHWSILTAFGDGMVSALKMADVEAAERIHQLAQRIRESGVPGVIVINLHPQNVGETHAMHMAAMEIISSGFIAWTMRDCINWFAERDADTRFVTIENGPVYRLKSWIQQLKLRHQTQ